jgi:hypothetical protein
MIFPGIFDIEQRAVENEEAGTLDIASRDFLIANEKKGGYHRAYNQNLMPHFIG